MTEEEQTYDGQADAGRHRFQGQDPLFEEDVWHDCFRPLLKENPEVAQEFARLLSTIRISVGSDSTVTEPDGWLSAALQLMFPYTATYRAARDLWMLSLLGVLEWKNEPDQLLGPRSSKATENSRVC